MKMKMLLVTVASILLSFSGCSKDPIITEATPPTTEKPTTPGEGNEKPQEPGTPGVDKNTPDTVADFTNWDSFLSSLNSFKLQKYATQAPNQGKNGNGALAIKGTPEGNHYVFTTENQSVNASAKTITFYIKGTASKSLSFNVYTSDKDYEVFNLRTDKQITDKTDITLSKDIVLQKTAKRNETNPNTGINDYVGVNINASNWIKITLDLDGVNYNKSAKGSSFALKVGKGGNYNLLIDNITFDNASPEVPVDPTNPTKPGDFTIPTDQTDYYAGIDFTKTGMELKAELTKLTTEKHEKNLSYGQIWDASKATDLTPDGNNVYLLYGHDGQTSGQTAYTRAKNNHGGGNGQWNREHTYAKSLGTPNLGEAGPGADAHHLRPADVQWNSARGNRPFATGNGTSKAVGANWYPGDNWKGDVARMMLYMYIRYGERCLPSNVAVGQKNSIDPNMINLLLEWNAEDPVSPIEERRNEYHGDKSNTYAQGNRNPFIDNPYLATQIWGGKTAKNLWTK